MSDTYYRDAYYRVQSKLDEAEAAIARVRELCESVQRGDNPWQWPAMILRALDGAE